MVIENQTLAINSPGGFPDGITIGNLLAAPPQARNPRLAEAFKQAGLVERTGRGINRVFRSQLALGRPEARLPALDTSLGGGAPASWTP